MPAIAAHKRSKPHTLYRAYDSSDQLVYIGLTNNWPMRLTAHEYSTHWWNKEVVRVHLEYWPSRAEGLTAERHAIRMERPLRNTHHNRGPVRRVVVDVGTYPE